MTHKILDVRMKEFMNLKLISDAFQILDYTLFPSTAPFFNFACDFECEIETHLEAARADVNVGGAGGEREERDAEHNTDSLVLIQ